ncbi:CLUMA_CG017901, isoform A [Clunio marinus]|uniref:CLUMA_CG017901, isoform A n=1 Tax=Clunio marinus TaxID=568069 RepID=A0A1J1IXP2_9DIPT|nr:CLUMA_CG017901, isoform A [Clunio marinus]
MVENISYLDDICRLCLATRSKENLQIFSKIESTTKTKFEDLTQIELSLNDDYPNNMCSECSDRLDSFYFYKNQLVRKQNELVQFLGIDNKIAVCNTKKQLYETTEDFITEEICLEEDLIEEDEFDVIYENEEVLDMTDEEIEVYDSHDEIIVESMEEGEKSSLTEFTEDFHDNQNQKVLRSEEIKYEIIEPKLILTPSQIATGMIKCEQCKMIFKKKHFYNKHLEKVHNNPSFICETCGKISHSRLQWRSHLRNHDQTLKYACNYEGCEKAFRVKHHLTNHLRSHTKESPFQCPFEGCSSKFRQKFALTVHLRKHTGEFITCDQCKSPFVTQFMLNKHKDKCNGTFKPLTLRNSSKFKKSQNYSDAYKCLFEECDETFKAKVTLQKHLSKVHKMNVTPTLCVICFQNFDSQQSLKIHQRDHLPFTCSLCSTSFKSRDNLENHLAKSHERNENRPHGCDQCSASFKRAEHLKTHIAYKHSNNRPFTCDVCSFIFASKSDLKVHMKIHLKTKSNFL